jgi:hypothetical protein
MHMWVNLRAGPRLSSLTLEPAHALLPPFGSHLVGSVGMRSAAVVGPGVFGAEEAPGAPRHAQLGIGKGVREGDRELTVL